MFYGQKCVGVNIKTRRGFAIIVLLTGLTLSSATSPDRASAIPLDQTATQQQLSSTGAVTGLADVLTYHNDNFRSGQNLERKYPYNQQRQLLLIWQAL